MNLCWICWNCTWEDFDWTTARTVPACWPGPVGRVESAGSSRSPTNRVESEPLKQNMILYNFMVLMMTSRDNSHSHVIIIIIIYKRQVPVTLSLSSLPQESRSNLEVGEKIKRVHQVKGDEVGTSGLSQSRELTLCGNVGWSSSYKEGREMLKVDWFLFHWLLTEGGENKEKYYLFIFIYICFLFFLSPSIGAHR